MIYEGINHKGFSLIDVLQPCVSFNKKNTYEWYSKRIYKLEEDKTYNSGDKMLAYEKASQWGDKIPIGIIYKSAKPTYEEKKGLFNMLPLVDQSIENIDIAEMLKDYV